MKADRIRTTARIPHIFLTGMLLAFAGSVFAQGPGGPGGPGRGPVQKTAVPVGTVGEREVLESSSYTGLVVSPAAVRISARVSGELLEVGFKDGSFVRKGQMLYRLDPVKCRASVKNAEAQIAQCRAKLGYAQKNFDRNDTLYKSQAVSQDTLDNSQSTLKALTASLNAAEAELISAQEDLKDCTITSPIDGIATPTNYTPGNYLTPSSGTLVSIVSADPIRVRFAVSARDFLSNFGTVDNLRTEGVVSVTLADGSRYGESGRIELMNIEANRNTDTVQVYALFHNPELKLIPNCTVTVSLAKKTGKTLPSVPVTAVRHDSQGAFVWFLAQGNRIQKRHVGLGNTDGTNQAVLSGLKKGDLIVTDGTHKVTDGMEIEPDRKAR